MPGIYKSVDRIPADVANIRTVGISQACCFSTLDIISRIVGCGGPGATTVTAKSVLGITVSYLLIRCIRCARWNQNLDALIFERSNPIGIALNYCNLDHCI